MKKLFSFFTVFCSFGLLTLQVMSGSSGFDRRCLAIDLNHVGRSGGDKKIDATTQNLINECASVLYKKRVFLETTDCDMMAKELVYKKINEYMQLFKK